MPQSLADAHAQVPCSNVANIGECKTGMQSEFCTWQYYIRGTELLKIYIECTITEDSQTSCKLWLISVEWRWCIDKAKTTNPLKVAGVPQTRQPISVISGRKFTILWGHLEKILLFNNFFSDCWHVPQLWRYSRTTLCGAQMAIFCIIFDSCIFPASHVQHISYTHSKFALRPHHAWKCSRHPISDRW